MRMARVWLHERDYVLPGDKRVRLLVGAALRHAEHTLCRRIATKFDSQTVAGWIKKLTASKDGTAVTVLEWLRDPPHRVSRRDITDHVERAQREAIARNAYIENLALISRALENSALKDGAFIECGTWKGGMSAGMIEVGGPDRNYFFFDSFEGLPLAKEIDGAAAIPF